MIPRLITKKIFEIIKGFPILVLTGPRQSGKSTLVKELFSDEYEYVSLEDLDMHLPKKILGDFLSNTVRKLFSMKCKMFLIFFLICKEL